MKTNWDLKAAIVQRCIYTCLLGYMSSHWIWFRCLHSPSTVNLHIVLLSISHYPMSELGETEVLRGKSFFINYQWQLSGSDRFLKSCRQILIIRNGEGQRNYECGEQDSVLWQELLAAEKLEDMFNWAPVCVLVLRVFFLFVCFKDGQTSLMVSHMPIFYWLSSYLFSSLILHWLSCS